MHTLLELLSRSNWIFQSHQQTFESAFSYLLILHQLLVYHYCCTSLNITVCILIRVMYKITCHALHDFFDKSRENHKNYHWHSRYNLCKQNFNVIDCNKTWFFSQKQIGDNGESEVGNITQKQKKLGKKNLKWETQILLETSIEFGNMRFGLET